ncbi:MAG: DUF1572 domain-containing protein [Holophagales bacterium]|nr:DUF1572 domain-containing protein [Holophagales bacterium]
MDGQAWLDEAILAFRRSKRQCEKAAEQVDDAAFFEALEGNPMSIALSMKHLAGNHRSRWRDFLTTDGEKRDRDRDREFRLEEGETRESIENRWQEAWTITFETLEALTPRDLDRTITIRGEPHTVVQAIQRSLGHAAYHTGQIVQLARHHAGEAWRSLSVPLGGSEQHNAEMRARYGDWWAREAD